jgi:hypothetical protein
MTGWVVVAVGYLAAAVVWGFLVVIGRRSGGEHR